MAIPLVDYQNPRFIRYQEGPTLSRDTSLQYANMVYGGSNTRAYRSMPQPGYNAQYPSTSIMRIDLTKNITSLPPSAR